MQLRHLKRQQPKEPHACGLMALADGNRLHQREAFTFIVIDVAEQFRKYVGATASNMN